MLYLMETSRVNLNHLKPLIVWNNPFGVDDRFTEKPDCWFAQAETENCPWVKFLKMSLFFRCYSHFFAVTNQLPGLSISRLASTEDFFNVDIFFKCKLNINVSINDYSFKYICVVCYLKFRFYYLICSAISISN